MYNNTLNKPILVFFGAEDLSWHTQVVSVCARIHHWLHFVQSSFYRTVSLTLTLDKSPSVSPRIPLSQQADVTLSDTSHVWVLNVFGSTWGRGAESLWANTRPSLCQLLSSRWNVRPEQLSNTETHKVNLASLKAFDAAFKQKYILNIRRKDH